MLMCTIFPTTTKQSLHPSCSCPWALTCQTGQWAQWAGGALWQLVAYSDCLGIHTVCLWCRSRTHMPSISPATRAGEGWLDLGVGEGDPPHLPLNPCPQAHIHLALHMHFMQRAVGVHFTQPASLSLRCAYGGPPTLPICLRPLGTHLVNNPTPFNPRPYTSLSPQH